MTDTPSDPSKSHPPQLLCSVRQSLVADLAAALEVGDDEQRPVPLADLAALTDGAGTLAGRNDARALLEAEAALSFIEEVSATRRVLPASLQQRLRARLGISAANTNPLPIERVMLLAAASGNADNGLRCVSDTGIWVLDIFTGGDTANDAPAATGTLLLEISDEHRASYEGRWLRVFVTTPEGARDLLYAPVRSGKVVAPVSLAGLDLRGRDALNLVFEAGSEAP